jgi:hypothetical protein
LFESIEYLDFSKKDFLTEAFAISQATLGGFGLSDLVDMDFRDYEHVVTKAIEILSSIFGDGGGDKGDDAE